MDIREKIAEILNRRFEPERLVLLDEGGVYGYIVSTRFMGLSHTDRHREIDRALPLSQRRRVLAIAPMTPEEFAEVDPDGAIGGVDRDAAAANRTAAGA